ncbi:MAG: hypothetical protein ABR524_05965 [Thermoanaerobaculia bacterium]
MRGTAAMKTFQTFTRCSFAILCVFLSVGALVADEVRNDEAVMAQASTAETEKQHEEGTDAKVNYLRIMPRFYDFTGDQGYLQRYRALDADNANGLDEALAVLNELSFTMYGPGHGAPTLEVLHSNPFILNDQWSLRYRPIAGSRLDLVWDKYQRPLEAFLPVAVANSITYAQRYNDDMDVDQELYKQRRDLALSARVEPFVWSNGLAFWRDVELSYGASTRTGHTQFNWIFGTVEDLVSPAGNNPERWRGRTELIDRNIDRFNLSATFAFGQGNVTRLRAFGEEFDNGAPTITNADIARISPAINTQPRTINFIADYSLGGGAFSIEQSLSERWLLVADGAAETLKQESFAPLEAQALHEAEIKTESLSGGVFFDATENLVLEATGRWSKRTNETPVGTSASEPRPYLVQDRNLSTPFLRELKSTAYTGVATYYAKKLTARFGASQEDSNRTFIRPVGSNAIPEALTVYRADSTPTTMWASLSGRPSKRIRWAGRYEYRTASDTWTISDPEKAKRLRATATLNSKSGMSGATAAFAWDDVSNEDFLLQTAAGSTQQRMAADSTNVALSGYHLLSPRFQINAGFQQIEHDQTANLILTDVRRWRPMVVTRLADDDFGYKSDVQILNLGASMALSDKLTLVPSVIRTAFQGGVQSEIAPVRAFTLLDGNTLTFALASDYRLSERSHVNVRYAYNDYEDETPNDLSGTLQELSVGLTFRF